MMKIYQKANYFDYTSRSGSKVVKCVIDFEMVSDAATIKDTVSATASCHPGDHYDYDKGKKIANTRATLLMLSRIKKEMTDTIEMLTKDFNEVLVKTKIMYWKQNAHLDNLLDDLIHD